MKKPTPITTPTERIDRAKAEFAAGDPGSAAIHALIAIAELLDQWLQPAADEAAETEIHWPDKAAAHHLPYNDAPSGPGTG